MRVNDGFSDLGMYMFTKLSDMAAQGGSDLIKLVTGNPDLETPQGIKDALRNSANNYYPDPPSWGMEDLRVAVAGYYQSRFGVNVPLDNIIIGHGTKSDMWDIGRVFSNPGDTYVIPDPSYPIVRDSGNFEGRLVKAVPFTDGKWKISIENFTDGQLALLYLCNPNNPNGIVLGIEETEDIVSRVNDVNGMVLSDIVYSDLQLLGERASPSVFEVESAKDVAVELWSPKAYSMTGHRISSFVTLNDEIAAYWKRFKSNRDKGTPVYAQLALLAALTDGTVKEEVDRYLEIYKQRALLLKTGFEDMGLKVGGLDHTPFAWVKLPGEIKSEEFADRLVKEASVLVVPGSYFSKTGEGYFRASIFQPKEKIEMALDRIKSFLQKYSA